MALRIDPPVLAHRGANTFAPENTLEAFKIAHTQGIQWIECDVQLAQQEPVVIHDETVNRTTDGEGYVANFTSQQLKKLHTRFGGQLTDFRIPSLEETIHFLVKNKMSANIEIKTWNRNDEEVSRRAIEVVEQIKLPATTTLLFSSFSVPALQSLRRHAKGAILLGLLMDNWLPNWEQICQELNCISVNVNHEMITSAEMVQAIKRKGLTLMCYTVDVPARAKELFLWGVDAVFSNRPDIMPRPDVEAFDTARPSMRIF